MNNTCYSFRYNSFLQLSVSFKITLSALFAITSLTAVSLNSLILYSIWKNPTLHKPSYLLLANLVFSDLMVGAIAENLAILVHSAYIRNWATLYWNYIFTSYQVTGYWLSSVSLYCLTLISVDRLLAIRLKNRYQSFVTPRRIWMVTIPFWVGMLVLLMLTLSVPNVLPQSSVYISTSCLIFAFLTLILFCYAKAFYLLKKLTSSVSSSSSQQPDNGSSNFDVSQYRRSMNTMILVMLTTLLCYLPYAGATITFSIKNGKTLDQNLYSLISRQVLSITGFIAATNSTVNPVVYLWRMQDIRQAVKTTVRRILRQDDHSVQD